MKKGIKKYFVGLAAVLFFANGKAQQLHFFSSWYDYALMYNPSIVGTDYHANVGILHRTQFAGFEGAPVMNLILADGKLKTRTAYVGGFVFNQHKGIFNNTQAQAMYAHCFNLNEQTYFKLGVALGVLDQNLNYAAIVVQNINDPNIFLTNQHKAALDANAGFSFYFKDLQVGFSVPGLLGSVLKYNDNQNVRAYYAMSRHYAASARYDIPLNAEKELYLTPFFLTRFVANAPLQFDGGLMFDWKERFRVGGMYRSSYAVTACASFTLNRRFSVSYNYDFPVGSISAYSGLTHELAFNCKIGKLKPKPGQDTTHPLQKKVNELEKEIAALKQKGNNNNNAADHNSPPNGNKGTKDQSGDGKKDFKRTTYKENGLQVITDHHSNYVFPNGNSVPKGFYVVVGSYYYQDYAEKEVKRYMNYGFPEADVFISKRDKFNYIFIYNAATKEEAMTKAAEAKVSGVTDVWIEVLAE